MSARQNQGSDFAREFFSAEENRLYKKLLDRLRSFEAAVCSKFREIENGLRVDGRETHSQIGNLEGLINELTANAEMEEFENREKIVKLEEKFERARRELSELSTRLENETRETKNLINSVQAKLESAEMELTKALGVLRGRVEILEMENLDEEIWIDNGHEDESMRFTENENEGLDESVEHEEEGENGEGENEGEGENGENEEREEMDDQDENENEERSCEIMMADPFLMTVAHPGVYDGNPAVSFSRWAAKFEDLLLICPQLTEPQKLSRLRISLAGQARGEFEAITPTTIQEALDHLKGKFENENTKSIARQAMSICRMAPGEKVYVFANRLSESVRTVLAGESEAAIQKRLLEEFLDRLTPDLQFEVKAGRPTDYSRAYELAQHFELLLASKMATHVSVAELTQKMEALTIQQQFSSRREVGERRICYYCRRQGHLVRECRKKRKDEGRQYGGRQNAFQRETRRDNAPWERGYRNRERDYDSRNRPPTPVARNNWQPRESYRGNSPSNNFERNGQRESYNSRSPRRVQFGGRVASARIASPILLAMIAILGIFGNVGASGIGVKPMICLSDAPTSIWTLPTDTICPNWSPTQISVPVELNIYRPNTLQYKTEATACSCVNTKISRRKGIFYGSEEEVTTVSENVPTPICKRMRESKYSPAGELHLINGTLMGTNNSLEVGWGFWPSNLFWKTETISNCYVYKTVVFTRYGMDGLNTPMGECPGCSYKSGVCHCAKDSLIWEPDKTQQCPYIWLSKWKGEYSTLIWITDSGDFALTFENISTHQHAGCYPGSGGLMLADQVFAIPMIEFDKMINKSREANWQQRGKRAVVEVGPVYSSQLAAQLTALSLKIAQTTQRLFTEAIRKFCTSLEMMADQVKTLSKANPSLLARHFLGNPFISARLITEKVLEVKPCLPIYEGEVHFHWQNGHCFEFLPIIFDLYGKQKHGFVDPITLIIYPSSKEVNCEETRYTYMERNGRLTRYDQLNGEMRQIPKEAIHQLTRHGKIDIPEMNFPLFKNKVLSNLTELYSPGQFWETMESVKIVQEITRLSNPNAWEVTTKHTDRIAGGIVAKGIFAFLRGGIMSLNQLWIFLCCCYITASVLIQFILPLPIAMSLQYLNIGGLIVKIILFLWRQIRKKSENKGKDEETAEETNNEKPKEKSLIKSVPLTERWPSPNERIKEKIGQKRGPNTAEGKKLKIRLDDKAGPSRITTAMVCETKCDQNYRVKGKVNGLEVILLMDTGAHISLCSMKTAEKLGITQLSPPEIRGVIGVSNKLVPIVGQSEISLNMAGCKTVTTISVIEKEIGKGSYDLIIGRNTFHMLPFLLDLQTGTLIKKNNERILVCDQMMEDKRNVFEVLIKNMEIRNPAEIEEIRKCLMTNRKAFSAHDYDLGTCQSISPKILTTTEVPARVKPYPVPEKYEKELKTHIGKMLEVGVIKESFTPWVHNIVLVKKTNGQLRPCVDFRPLNKVTIPDPYPLPRMDKVIFRAAGKKWYSTLDLASGFWQIPLDEDSSYKCGIITPWGLYQMLKLPFGLRNAPSIFQRTMDKTLEGIENVTVYIDDILIHTNTIKDHLKTLDKVFIRLQKNGLKLKGEKCKFFQRKCIYLGHILSEIGYQPSLTNKEVIEKFPEPKNVKEIKRFLGMVSFFRKFIPNFATIAHPLNRLTRGQIIFEWGEQERKAMDELRKHLLQTPCLRPPDYNLKFYLFTDASAVAYGAALMQSQAENEMHAIGYWSRTLSEVESRLPPTHGELAAIVHAMQNFRAILYGAELVILTDHRPLTFLFQKASVNPKLNRWLMCLQEYEPKVIYVEGRANKVADALSRVPILWECVESKIKDEIPYLLILEEGGLNRKKVEKEIKNDPILSKVIIKIKENWNEPVGDELEPFYQNRNSLYLEGDLIRKYPQGQIVIPQNLKTTILEMVHRAHFGIVRGKAKARRYVWWPKISEDIEEFVKECEICQRNAPAPPKSSPEHKWPEARYPFERLHVDLAGPIWGTNFLVMVDAFSKFPFVHQINSTNSWALIASFREVFAIFGSPRTIVSDNGPQFVSAELKEFLMEESVNHLTSPPYHPASNGEAERFVRTFKENIKKLLDAGKPLKLAQFIFLQEYRASPCQTLGGESPAQKFLKRELRTEMDKIKMMPQIVQPEIESENPQASNPAIENKGRKVLRRQVEFDPGDSVWYREQLTKKWCPGVLLEPMGERMWKVELEGGGEKVAHIDQIKGRRIAVRH